MLYVHRYSRSHMQWAVSIDLGSYELFPDDLNNDDFC